jgi:hypothetical protein
MSTLATVLYTFNKVSEEILKEGNITYINMVGEEESSFVSFKDKEKMVEILRGITNDCMKLAIVNGADYYDIMDMYIFMLEADRKYSTHVMFLKGMIKNMRK